MNENADESKKLCCTESKENTERVNFVWVCVLSFCPVAACERAWDLLDLAVIVSVCVRFGVSCGAMWCFREALCFPSLQLTI